MAFNLGISGKTLSKIINERGSITPDMALRLSRAFDTTPYLWMNLQKNYDLWQAFVNLSPITPLNHSNTLLNFSLYLEISSSLDINALPTNQIISNIIINFKGKLADNL